jgi:hypothetical protein
MTKSSFVSAGAESDFFWTATVATEGYDPTIYSEAGAGARTAVLAELRAAANESVWAAANVFVGAPAVPVDSSYLQNWHFLRLAHAQTTDGHPIALPLPGGTTAATTSLVVHGGCDFAPKPTAAIRAVVEQQPCGACEAERVVELSLATLTLLVALGLLVAAALRCYSRGCSCLLAWRPSGQAEAPLKGLRVPLMRDGG